MFYLLSLISGLVPTLFLHHGHGTNHFLEHLAIYIPVILVLIAVAIWWARKKYLQRAQNEYKT